MKQGIPLTKKQKIGIVTLNRYYFGISANESNAAILNFEYHKPLEKGSLEYVLQKIDSIEGYKVEFEKDKAKLTEEGIAYTQKEIAFLEEQLLNEVKELGLNSKLNNYEDLKNTYAGLRKVTPPEEKILTEAEIDKEVGVIISFLKGMEKEKEFYNSLEAKHSLEEEERLSFLKAIDNDKQRLLERAKELGKVIKPEDYK